MSSREQQYHGTVEGYCCFTIQAKIIPLLLRIGKCKNLTLLSGLTKPNFVLVLCVGLRRVEN